MLFNRIRSKQKKEPARAAPCRHQIAVGQNGNETEQLEACLECKAEKRSARTYRTKIILGLILPFALQSLDVTIIAAALPWIAADFGQIAQLNWIISSFNLTSAAFIPFWGQMADIFGRHWALQAALVLMLIGSALCTGAPTTAFGLLLFGRAIQGIACAGIAVIVRVILADKVSLKENARNWTIFSLTAGASYSLGPVVGGNLTAVNWRWCFGINLPIAFVGIFVVFFILRPELLGPQPIPELDELRTGRRERFAKRLTTIDVGGQLLLLLGFGLLILALTWAGATYDWNTPAILVPLIFGALITVGWIYYEYLMTPDQVLGRKLHFQRPMVPWRLFLNRNISLLFYINFATGMAMYSVLYFCDLYFTMVKLQTASRAGVQLLFYTPGIGAGVLLSMFFTNKWPRQTFPSLLLGSVIEAVGVGMMAWGLDNEHSPTIYGMMGLTGAGTGLRFMPGSVHAIGFFPDHIATVVALMSVAIPLGGTLALTIMATVFNNVSGIARDSPFRNFSMLAALPKDVLDQVTHNAKVGIVWAFVALVPFMVICVAAAAALGNVTIPKEEKDGDVGAGRGAKLVHGSYLVALFRGEAGTSRKSDTENQEKVTEQQRE